VSVSVSVSVSVYLNLSDMIVMHTHTVNSVGITVSRRREVLDVRVCHCALRLTHLGECCVRVCVCV